MPGFNEPLWFDTVTSTVKTRFRSSAFGEILVTRPLITFGVILQAN